MIAFIDDHRRAHGVEPICKVLPIAPSTYRAHIARRADPARLPARARRDLVLKADIRRVFDTNFGVYGMRRCGASSGGRERTSRDARSAASCGKWAYRASCAAARFAPPSAARLWPARSTGHL